VKLKDLEQRLRELGYKEIGGSKHAKWTDGKTVVMVPRHKEINEYTAKGIIRSAEQGVIKRNSK
jgi:hypothetical protein